MMVSNESSEHTLETTRSTTTYEHTVAPVLPQKTATTTNSAYTPMLTFSSILNDRS